MEEAVDELHEVGGQLRVVARTFVAEKGVRAIDFMPLKARVNFIEAVEERHAAIRGDVRVLAAPGHEELALDVSRSGERVVVLALAEGAGVQVSGIEADRSSNLRVHGAAKGEMTAEADAYGSQFARAVEVGSKPGDKGGGVGVVGGHGFAELELIATVRAGLVVGEDGTGGFKLVIDLRDRDKVAMTRERGGLTPDG